MTATINCAHCGGSLGRSDRFCDQCGAEVYSCVTCGEPLLPSDLACPACGAPAEPVPSDEALSFHPTDAQAPWLDMVRRLRRATFGEFEIGRELGRGGMAIVFLAHETSLARKVAIKVMSPGLLLDDGMIDRFRHEAITIAHLHHPNIVSLYSVRQAEGLHFFVMQYVQGRSLEQVIQLGGRLPIPAVLSILSQVGSALTYAHRSRVIHRDIKPANILIDGDGNAVVTDFGIAKAAKTPSQTLTGALVGTPAYMSPEQCRGTEVSGASDQYSLGAVAYEMLTGAPPFGGSTLTVMQAHVERPPIPIRDLTAVCPPDLEAAILRMLAKDPADRWPRMADAISALGAKPLAEDDPLRSELSRLIAVMGPDPLPESPAAATPVPDADRPSAADGLGDLTVSDISILPPPAGLEVGDSFVLVATVRGRNGICLPSNAVTWMGDAPEVLRFASGGGEAVAVGAGSMLLTATCREVQAVLRVEVASPRADEIAIAPLEVSVGAGDEIRLEAVVLDKRGEPIARSVEWMSDDSAAATITANGELVALAPGFTRITAALDEASASVVIPILPARVAAIHVADQPATVPAGKSFDVVATPVDRWGSPLSGRRVRWSSSDTRVVVATAEGRVQTVQSGSAVLTASCEGVSESLRVSVGAPAAPVEPDPVSEPRRVKVRKARRHRREKILGAALGAPLVAVALWFYGRARPPQTPAETAPAVSEAIQDEDSGIQTGAATTAAPPPQVAPKRATGATRSRPPRSSPGGDSLPRSEQSSSASVSVAAGDLESGGGSIDREAALVDTTSVMSPVIESAPQTIEAADPLLDRQAAEAQILAGAERCYAALQSKNVAGLTELYHPVTPSDRNTLKKLRRLLQTREWSANVGQRVDGNRQIGVDAALMDFSVPLKWKDAFGGHLSSQPVFRAEFTRNGGRWEMASCRIVGSPRL